MRLLGVFGLSAISTLALSQVWAEQGDAPDGVPANQMTVGTGPLTSITGSINRAGGDHVDTYCIDVTDTAAFFATTKNFFGGFARTAAGANIDTRLWLWRGSTMVVANDDVDTASLGTDTLGSLISDPTTFGTLTGGELVNASAANQVVTPGRYNLSISMFSNDPDDGVGADMANLGADFDALHGPNPAAGAFATWENAASTSAWTYNIALNGATYCENPVPEPATMAVLGVGALALIRKRRAR